MKILSPVGVRQFYLVWAFVAVLFIVNGCTKPEEVSKTEVIAVIETADKITQTELTPTSETSPQAKELADVMSVEVSGEENAYRFAVEISSPDTGCDQYADWWEVLSEDGTLLYRRILAHSHRDEQPFVRSGGPVNISKSTIVIIRAHMHPDGYGGMALKGTVANGLTPIDISPDFAVTLETEPPLPEDCAF
jgi:hypothetical protein